MSQSCIKVTYNRFPEIAAKLPNACKDVVRKTAFDCQAAAKAELYEGHGVDTGLLKSGINTEFNDGGLQAIVAPHTEYGIYVELGHHSFPGYFYMTKAAESVRGAFMSAMKQLEGRLR